MKLRDVKPRGPMPGVLTAGAWGTSLAQAMARAGQPVMVWDRDLRVVEDINQRHENRRRFPGIPLDEKVTATADLATLFKHCEVIFVALPSEVNMTMARQVDGMAGAQHCLVMASKGLRESDGALLSTVWKEACPLPEQVILTGPTFARELMEGKVTAFIVAGEATARARVADLFDVPFVRVYESDDMIGAQLGGALKNVMAIAAGILDGMELGYNARAALLARGLAEMARYTRMMGGEERTIWGLAGMGDLLLTATSPLSRNFRFGQMIGRGVSLDEAKAKVGTVEGIAAARIATVQAQARGIDLAVVSAVDGILHGDVTPLRVMEYLMQRPRMEEFV